MEGKCLACFCKWWGRFSMGVKCWLGQSSARFARAEDAALCSHIFRTTLEKPVNWECWNEAAQASREEVINTSNICLCCFPPCTILLSELKRRNTQLSESTQENSNNVVLCTKHQVPWLTQAGLVTQQLRQFWFGFSGHHLCLDSSPEYLESFLWACPVSDLVQSLHVYPAYFKQNHSITEVGKDLQSSSSPACAPSPPWHSAQSTEYHIQVFLEHLRG